MKITFFLLSLLALAPVAHAQTKTSNALPFLEIDPGAKRLLGEARAKYSSLKSLSFEMKSQFNGKEQGQASVAFRAPNSLKLTQTRNAKTQTILCHGSNIFVDRGATYSDLSLAGDVNLPVPQLNRETVVDLFSNVGIAGAGFLMTDWIQNRWRYDDPRLVASGKKYGFRTRISLVAPQPFNGAQLRGVKIETLPVKPKAFNASDQTLWFDMTTPTLRRVERHASFGNDKPSVMIDALFNVRLNPSLPASTFAFSRGNKKADKDTSPFYYDPRLVEGSTPPAWSAPTLSGMKLPVSPADYKGKVLILDFWATWCGPCVESLPELQAVYNKHHAQGLEVVGISLDEDKKQLETFLKARKMPWPQVFDGKGWKSEVAGLYGVHAIPFFLIVGKDGKIAAVNPREDLEGAVKAALAAS